MDFFIYLSAALLILLGLVVIRIRFMGFQAQSSDDYVAFGPEFDLRAVFSGTRLCEGVIFGPTGRVLSRFRATMTGRWDGDDGIVEVDFRYDSGATQHRAWHMTLGEDGAFRADADDVHGVGRGQCTGAGCRLTYRIVLPEDAGGHTLSVVDWMYLMDDGMIVNRSQFRKFGICMAELVASIRPVEPGTRP